MRRNDKRNTLKTASICRAGRKMMGLTQEELANRLKISQGSLSKYEAALQMPSACDWYQLCSELTIDSHQAIRFGCIDNQANFRQALYQNNTFRMNERYKEDDFLKIREIRPIWEYIKTKVSKEELNIYLKEKGIDSDIFCVLDIQVSLYLLLDLLDFAQQKIKSDALIEELILFISKSYIHDSLFDDYSQCNNLKKLFKKIAKYNPLYNNVYKFSVLETDEALSCKGYVGKNIFLKGDYLNHSGFEKYTDFKLRSLKELVSMNTSFSDEVKLFNTKRDTSWDLTLRSSVSN